MPSGTFEMNKNFASNAIGDNYVEQGKAACREKLASKELWVDEAHHGFKYANPQKLCSTPGDAYASVAQKNIEVRKSSARIFFDTVIHISSDHHAEQAFPPMGTYPPRGIRAKVDVADLKDFRNIFTSPSKKGMGGYVGHPGVLLTPFPEYRPDDYDAERKSWRSDAHKHREAQAANDERCRYVPTVRSGTPGHMEAHPAL